MVFANLLSVHRLLAPGGRDLCVHTPSLCGAEEVSGRNQAKSLCCWDCWFGLTSWVGALGRKLDCFLSSSFFFFNLLLFTLRCCWVVFEFPWNSSCYWAGVFILLMAQLPRRKCRFVWFLCPWGITKNEQFLNASIVTYSGMLLPHIFGRVLNVFPEERVHITGE